MKKIIFVCTGNTCRSQMAKAIFLRKLKRLKIKNVEVLSAGVSVNEGDVIEPKAKKVLHENGIRVGRQYATQLKSNMVDQDTVLITMTKQHKTYLKHVKTKVISMGEVIGGVDIPDPYGRDIEAYRKCYKIIDFILDEVVEMLLKGDL